MFKYQRAWFLLLLLLLTAIGRPTAGWSQERIIRAIRAVPNRFIRTVTHPDFVAFLDYTVSFMHVYYDASYDAVFWQISANRSLNWSIQTINQSMHGGANLYNIHYYKNMARLALVLKGYCVGISLIHIKDGKLDSRRLLRRELGMLPAMMTVWQLRYKYCRYGEAWDTSARHNGSRYVIPLPTGDVKIGFSNWQVDLVNLMELGISGYFIGRDVYEDFRAKKQQQKLDRLDYRAQRWRQDRFHPAVLLGAAE